MSFADLQKLIPAPSVPAGAHILDAVRKFLGRFVTFPSPAELDAVTLWAAHAHLVGVGENSPRLALLSPEPASGKTRTLEVLELLVPAPMPSVSASPAAIFRSLANGQRTLLFDEVDTIFGTNRKDDGSEELRALLNAGHRRGATIPRCVGPMHAVADFPVFAAVALAGLGDLPDTVMSRSIPIRMRRRLASESVEPFRRRLELPVGIVLRDRLASWCDQVSEALYEAWPEMPDGVTDRAADVWEPLLAIADLAGGHWPETARTACTVLVKVVESRESSLGIKLLSDIRQVFAKADAERMSSSDLLDSLNKLDESPWADLRGKPLNARGLASRLHKYGVRPHQFRTGEAREIKIRGYSINGSDGDGGGLGDAFSRYLATIAIEESATGGTAGTAGTEHVRPSRFAPQSGVSAGTSESAVSPVEAMTWVVPLVPEVPDKRRPESKDESGSVSFPDGENNRTFEQFDLDALLEGC